MNPSTELADILIQELATAGVTDVVLSPGSRSTPLALGFAQLERSGQVRLHVRIDERCAGYLALGLAKESLRPVALVCTSGTAVANLMPAVVEATYSGIPLVVLTADRPERLRRVGANQTIDQVGFFGQQVRTSKDIHADGSRGNAVVARQTVRAALRLARGDGSNGCAPVHLNLAFDEPLTPDIEFAYPAPDERSEPSSPREPFEYALADIGLSQLPPRGVVLVGDVPSVERSQQAIELAESCGWPIICEPSGNATGSTHFISHASVLGDSTPNDIELVVTIGRFGISRSTLALVRSAARHIAVWVGGKDRPDPTSTAELVLTAIPRPLSRPVTAGNWLASWQEASAVAATRISDALAGSPMTGAAVARSVLASLTDDELLFLGSSRTVRYFEALAVHSMRQPWIAGNRGSSGIDGLVSTAWGMALSRQSRDPYARTVAVLGDLAFLHDHNAFIVPAAEQAPNLTLVIVDNKGGGIFSALEQGAPQFAVDFERVFGTPQAVDVAAIAGAVCHDVRVVSTGADLTSILIEGVEGIRIVIVRTDRTVEQAQWEQL